MKIALIGPTYPFRGGIAHHTTLVCKTLRKNHEVLFISFNKQYPEFLFPGKTDKDTSTIPIKVEPVHYIINSLNPMTWIHTVLAIKRFNPSKVIIPWWVTFWVPQFYTIITGIKLFLKAEVVIICHNSAEHESSFFKKQATKLVLSKGDTFITHSQEEHQRLKKLLGESRNIITAFHPTYAEFNLKENTKDESKKKLNLKGDVLLFFGFVREYKGLHILLNAMPDILKQKHVTLLIVGEFWHDKNVYLDMIMRLGLKEKVKIIDKYIPNEELGLYFSASDLVVQPYISVTGSGVAQLAYGFDRPVIATNIGALSEIVENKVNGRLVEPGNYKSLAQAVIESLDKTVLENFTNNAAKTKEKFSWERFAEILCGQ